jgi:uncharacterized membrane protein YeaQ/YmgE (transglycosylase-associated protein family)
MIGMNFPSFIGLLLISAVCAFVFHSLFKLRVLWRGEGYLCEWIMGWIGAWIGSPVVGHWGWMVPGGDVYLGPAIIGSMSICSLMSVLVSAVIL